jgi:hypothetical protein
MKHLKSSLKDLREIFERSIIIREIAEPLSSFDVNSSVDNVKQFMSTKDYDVIGVREDGLICGYARKSELSEGKIGDYLIHFGENEKFPETTSLIKVLKLFRDLDRIFVLFLEQVGGIVTRGDLQKAPVRMWLFGLISLIEMQLLRIIRESYPEEEWKDLINQHRLNNANKILSERQSNNTAIDLADCLQFCDKRDIVLKSNEIGEKLGFNNKSEFFLKGLEELRNNLCHAQDIITGNWPNIIDLAIEAENFLHKCEEF